MCMVNTRKVKTLLAYTGDIGTQSGGKTMDKMNNFQCINYYSNRMKELQPG